MMTGAIFDADGTPLDSMPVWDHAGERYLTGLGIVGGINHTVEEAYFHEVSLKPGAPPFAAI